MIITKIRGKSQRRTERSGRLKSSKLSSSFVVNDSILDTDIAILSVLLNNHVRTRSIVSQTTNIVDNQPAAAKI